MLLRGKNAILTGASRGIGRATAEVFAQNGANLWACASKQRPEFEEDMRQLAEKYHVAIQPVYFDLADEISMKEAVRTIVKSKKAIDVLVNNAGVAEYHPFAMMPKDTMQRMMDINFFAPLQFTQMLARRMGRKSPASIIFLSSVAGLRGESGNLAYGSSKAAVAHAVKVLSRELASQHIRVNGVAPGMVNTDMKAQANSDYWESLIHQVYLKRAAEPTEIANVIAFLASDLSSYVNGQIVRVDGGVQ